jgi:hypothetical protein
MLPVLETIAVEIEPNPDVIAEAETLTIQPEEEAQLTAEVESLWAEHQKVTATKKTSSAELRQIRQELGRKLFECKQLLARPGRGGEWSGWLKERGISRATADRWVNRHVESIGEPDNRITGAIPTEDAIEKLLTGFVQKAKQLIPDNVARYQFAYRLIEQLGLQVEETDESFVVLEPEVESEEPDSDEVGDGLFTRRGFDSEEVVDDGELDRAVDEADDKPTTITAQQKHPIVL